MLVGPSAPPMMAMDAASLTEKPGAWPEEGDEDAELGRRPQEKGDGVGKQGREVRQGLLCP
ncbi:hypothetical protein MASR2M17_00110 [Aminivibrio sp.]